MALLPFTAALFTLPPRQPPTEASAQNRLVCGLHPRAHLKRADCRRTAKLIIELLWNSNWAGGREKVSLEVVRRFFEPSEGESGRMAEGKT
jgi:hypothetical protein